MKIPISNKEIPPSLFEKASAAAGNEEILFAICGDLDSGSRYSESLLLATKSKVISLDGENAEVFSASFEEIEDAAVKRMYGNAVLSVKIGGKRKNIFRCTYVRPQLPALVVALVISLVTTSITLLPPYITKMLVDDIIPSGKVNSLFLVVGFLFISYLVLFIAMIPINVKNCTMTSCEIRMINA